jgi:hypothetical protein
MTERENALREALEFYANHNHWMGLTEASDSPQKLLIANGNVKGTEGWSVAEAALAASSQESK